MDEQIAVRFEHFTFQYYAQAEPTLHDINLEIRKHEKVLIVGPSGSGKSTLAHCINGLIPFAFKGKIEGKLELDGQDTAGMNIFDRSIKVGTVLQDSDTQFVGLSVAEDIAFAAGHELVHTALWGMAESTLPKIKEKNPGVLVSFDYADRLDHPLVEQTLPFVDYGFFSYHESRDAFIEDYLRDKVDRGMKIAVATFGDKGSLAWDGKEFTQWGICPAPQVVNTVGAGDSFIAGFLCGLLRGRSVADCLALGAKTAAAVVQVFEPWVKDN